jgi:hypothetical protein
MHGSGTSAMTRVLALSGAQLPNDLHPAGPDNETGFWESKSVIALNEEILAAYDTGWDDIFAGIPRHYLSNFDATFRYKAAEVMGSIFGEAGTIVLKDPRINVLGAFWDRALAMEGYDPAYVIMVRNPLEVAASMLKRNKLPTDTGLLLWLDHMLAAERDTRGAKRLFVTYEDLLSDWRSCLDRIEQVTSVPLPRRTSASANAVEQFLSPSLRHYPATDEGIVEQTKLRRMVGEAYAWFKAAAGGEAPEDFKVLEQLRAYLSDLHDAVGSLVADNRSQLTDYQKHVSGLEGVIHNLRNEITLLEETVASGKAERVALEAAIAAAEASLEGQSSGLARLRAELEAKGAKELEALNATIFNLRDEGAALTTQLDAANEALAAEVARAETAEKDAALVSARCLELRAEVFRLQGATEAALARSRSLEAEVADAAAEQARTQSEQTIKDLSAKCGELELELRRVRESDRNREHDVNIARAQVAALDHAAAIMSAELAALREERHHILSSTTWKVTSIPRRLISRLRRLRRS